ncbi:MAG: SDR family oxidoreductase [Rhizobiaceae bacterium]|nr:SDR family oxidoreductase [Rhizobiaceae bacterium]
MPLALITGAAKRIGASIALGLADAGFDIVVHVNTSKKDGEAMVGKIRERGVGAQLYVQDLAQVDQISSMIGSIADSMGAIDLVVNNASGFIFDTPGDFDHQLAQKLLNINLLAPAEITRCFAKHCTRDGMVVNMLDNKIFSLNPDFYSYTMTKVALKGATEMMAMGFAGRLRVNAIAPGVTLISGDQSQENFEKSWRKSLSGVGATPQEIADTVLYLWKTKSINGETIVLDGGQRLMGLERDVAFMIEQEDD